jgi:hypothetical protein
VRKSVKEEPGVRYADGSRSPEVLTRRPSG